MATTDLRIAVIGAGHGGKSMAAELATRGFAVTLYNRTPANIEAVKLRGGIELITEDGRELFGRLLCQCGACERLPLDTCVCGWADDKRREIRERLAVGESAEGIVSSYRALYGVKALAVPPTRASTA